MLFTSEQVSKGHPDKVCDQISDKIVTEALRQDKHSRVAVEAMIKGYNITLAGEITTEADLDYPSLVRGVLQDIGLPDVNKYIVTEYLSVQSPDIAQSTNDEVGGAGDQGIMFGYATDETESLMPLPYVLATAMLQKLDEERGNLAKQGYHFGVDAKSQVTFDYAANKIDTVVISCQHSADTSLEDVRSILEDVSNQTAEEFNLADGFRIYANPAGTFIEGGSFADAGLTGRKIIADTYGGFCRHGGGAFSGKDPTKVDRSAAYACRAMARYLVKQGYCRKCEVQVGYAIGRPEPVSLYVNTFGTTSEGLVDEELVAVLYRNFDLTPAGIIKRFDLTSFDYYNLVSKYGHFGKKELPWEI